MTITDGPAGPVIASLSAAASSLSDADYPPAAYRTEGATGSINYTITGVGAVGTIYSNED